MNVQHLLDALDIQENAAQALVDDLRTRFGELQNRLLKATTRLEHLAITRKTVTVLADRLPTRTIGRIADWVTEAPYPR
ncbi:hypothetical protein [Kitasatospora sp. NPDC006786]|uniref:hypothetical protein n=1 Tax=unclassified Kitasatospora TaxID=2633591 RepID=UPI0033C07E12